MQKGKWHRHSCLCAHALNHRQECRCHCSKTAPELEGGEPTAAFPRARSPTLQLVRIMCDGASLLTTMRILSREQARSHTDHERVFGNAPELAPEISFVLGPMLRSLSVTVSEVERSIVSEVERSIVSEVERLRLGLGLL
jgi:hypothetical protein